MQNSAAADDLSRLGLLLDPRGDQPRTDALAAGCARHEYSRTP